MVENVKQIQVPTRPNGAKAEGCPRHCFNMCCVAQPTEDTPIQIRQRDNPSR